MVRERQYQKPAEAYNLSLFACFNVLTIPKQFA